MNITKNYNHKASYRPQNPMRFKVNIKDLKVPQHLKIRPEDNRLQPEANGGIDYLQEKYKIIINYLREVTNKTVDTIKTSYGDPLKIGDAAIYNPINGNTVEEVKIEAFGYKNIMEYVKGAVVFVKTKDGKIKALEEGDIYSLEEAKNLMTRINKS